jgi:sugar phosphate isomerase/epimerase
MAALLKALKDVNFKGSLSIEYEAKADEPTEDVKACVEVVKDAAKKV